MIWFDKTASNDSHLCHLVSFRETLERWKSQKTATYGWHMGVYSMFFHAHTIRQALKQKSHSRSPHWLVCRGQMWNWCIQLRAQAQLSLKKHIILFGLLYSLALLWSNDYYQLFGSGEDWKAGKHCVSCWQLPNKITPSLSCYSWNSQLSCQWWGQ